MQLYERFGIRHNDEYFYIGSLCIGGGCLYNNKHATKHLLQNAELRKLTPRYVAELADIGFMMFTMIICRADAIEIHYTSPYTDDITGAVVVSNHDVAARIYINGTDWSLVKFKTYHPKYMNILVHMKRSRAEIIKNIMALLPQPIAEEIDAEFILI